MKGAVSYSGLRCFLRGRKRQAGSRKPTILAAACDEGSRGGKPVSDAEPVAAYAASAPPACYKAEVDDLPDCPHHR